jgi:hypothetical protein
VASSRSVSPEPPKASATPPPSSLHPSRLPPSSAPPRHRHPLFSPQPWPSFSPRVAPASLRRNAAAAPPPLFAAVAGCICYHWSRHRRLLRPGGHATIVSTNNHFASLRPASVPRRCSPTTKVRSSSRWIFLNVGEHLQLKSCPIRIPRYSDKIHLLREFKL